MKTVHTIGKEVEKIGGVVESFEPFISHSDLWHINTENGTRNHAWRSIDDLLECDYWNRVWIVQEISLASSCFIMVGDIFLELSLLLNFGAFLNALSSGVLSPKRPYPDVLPYIAIPGIFNTMVITRIEVFRSGPQAIDPLLRLRATQPCLATDPRDKLYAILPVEYSGLVADTLNLLRKCIWNLP